MYKIAVMGDIDSIYGYSSAGLDIYPVDNVSNAGKTLRDLAENDYAIIYVTEALCPYIIKEIEFYRESILPAIIPIPGVYGNSGYAMDQIRKSVIRAVGSDILFGDRE